MNLSPDFGRLKVFLICLGVIPYISFVSEFACVELKEVQTYMCGLIIDLIEATSSVVWAYFLEESQLSQDFPAPNWYQRRGPLQQFRNLLLF